MKKSPIYLVILLMAVNNLFAAPPQSLSKYVPDDVIFFAEVKELESAWNSIERSNFREKLSSLKMLERTEISARISRLGEQFKSQTGFRLSQGNIMALAGREFAVSVYAEPDEKGGPVKIEVVLLARSNPVSVVEGIVSKLEATAKEKMAGEASFSSVDYDARKIFSIKPTGGESPVELRYVFDNDIFILGAGNMRPRIEKFLDCAAGKVAALEGLPQYLKVRAITSPVGRAAFLSMYVDIARLNTIKNTVGDESLDVLRLIDQLSGRFSPGRAAGLAAAIDGGVKLKTIVFPNEDNPSELEKIRAAAQPAAGVNRNYIPKETTVYFAINSMPDATKAYPEVVKLWQADPAASFQAQFLEQIERVLDIEIQKVILPFMGDEIAFVSTGVDSETYGFPMPMAALMIKVKNREKAAAFTAKLEKAIRDNMPEGLIRAGFKQDFHEGITIHYLELPNPFGSDAEPLKPCYAFVDDFLIVGTSVEFVKSMIDVSKGRTRGLIDSSLYKKARMPEKTNSVLFVNWERAIQDANSAIEWYIKFAESAGKGENALAFADNHLFPVVEVLSVVRYFSFHRLNTPQGEETSLQIRLEDLPGI